MSVAGERLRDSKQDEYSEDCYDNEVCVVNESSVVEIEGRKGGRGG